MTVSSQLVGRITWLIDEKLDHLPVDTVNDFESCRIALSAILQTPSTPLQLPQKIKDWADTIAEFHDHPEDYATPTDVPTVTEIFNTRIALKIGKLEHLAPTEKQNILQARETQRASAAAYLSRVAHLRPPAQGTEAHVETETQLLTEQQRRFQEEGYLADVQREGLALQTVPLIFRTENICRAAVQQDGRALRYVPTPLRTEAICMAAVRQDGRSLGYVPESLKTEIMCVIAVHRYRQALEYVPEGLKRRYLAAVQQNGRALQSIPVFLRTTSICMAAVQQEGWALQFVPEALKTEAICLIAVQKDGWALQFVPTTLKTIPICMAAVQQKKQVLQFVPEVLKMQITDRMTYPFMF